MSYNYQKSLRNSYRKELDSSIKKTYQNSPLNRSRLGQSNSNSSLGEEHKIVYTASKDKKLFPHRSNNN